MITIFSLLLGFQAAWALKSMNPIKVSMSVLMMSIVLFFLMSLNSGMTWFSLVLLMLFMGGIIMMFMILSSILPNEKSMKSKSSMWIMLALITMSFTSPYPTTTESTAANMKSFLMDSWSFFLMMGIVLFYFLGSMSILSSEQTPMRSLSCFQTLIL